MSSIAASGDTALPADAFGPRSALKARFLSALILGPLTLLALYAGGAWFFAMVLAMVGVMAWEWRRLCTRGAFDGAGWLFAAGALAAVCAAPLLGLPGALAVGGLAALAVGIVAKLGGDRDVAWSVVGVLAVALAGISLVWLRAYPEGGLGVTFWLLVSVWFTDCFAFFAGRLIGGPKLAPAISPGKTWAGLAGGVAGAAGWSAAFAALSGAHDPLVLAAAGALVAVVAQAGDLAVSMVKRRFGAKDSSRLIPGHGGVLDRVDGLILTAPALMLALAPWSEGTGR